ncbi:hypothetical protein BLNAU_8563 [Blattamonas nauphoetae]|uniref:Uncharacterized protein n=1 Tax=Blattamonas nauphoetae TaxID=2049346 RepID=A0ABQ9XYH7_9EUKA|nr:hypothetical protein BLNAU_8563 [Blattamonas nauphoetae]
MSKSCSSNVQFDPRTKPESESNQIVIVFQEVTNQTEPIQFFVPVKPTTTIGEAKQEFSEMFTRQYPHILPNALVWREISSPFSDQVDPLPISQESDTMVVSNVLATLHPNNPSPYPSLLAMTFTSAGLRAPPYSHQAEIPNFEDAACEPALKAVLTRIARNVFVAIDSSIGPLSQSEFPNYDERPDEIMPLDKSKFMLKTVSSDPFVENLEHNLKDILFRPSWFSIIDHVLFHATVFQQFCKFERSRPMVHVVTGSSGIGKSAFRFPCITMAMSLGAERVYTAKGNEYPLQFVLREKREISPQNQPPTLVVHRNNKPPRSVEIEPTLYTYDVLLFPTKVKAPSDGDVDYKQADIFKGTPLKLGEVTVPSIHHFPHFLRLFVDHTGHIHNPLEGKTWHVVDELVLAAPNLKSSQQYVLLSSPDQTRWKHVIFLKNQRTISFMMYTMPQYTLAEAVDVLNSIPCKFQNADGSSRKAIVEHLKDTINSLGFTPRCIQDLSQQEETPENVRNRWKSIDVTGNLFKQCVTSGLILMDSPQADPINFTTAYASPEAQTTMADLCTRQLQANSTLFEASRPDDRFTPSGLRNRELPTIFKRLVNQSIRVGAKFSRLKRCGHDSTTSAETQLSFPATPDRSVVDTSGQSTMHHAFLPDMGSVNSSTLNKFDEDKWGRYFDTPMNDFTFTSGPAEWRDGMFEFVRVGRGRQTEERGTEPNRPQTRSTRRSDSNLDLRYYTFHLVPHGLFNADFDSMLLFFRVDSNTNEIHSLSVHFLLDSIEDEHVVTEEGANLMKAWLVLLMDVYELDAHQVFPHLMFVVSERVFTNFVPKWTNTIRFIPNENIVVVALTTPTAATIADVRIEVEDTLMIDTGKRLTPNTDPLCVRCGFCGKVLGEHFCHHRCTYSIYGESPLVLHSELIRPQMKRHSAFVSDSEMSEMEVRLMNRIANTSPAFVYTQKTLSERDNSREEPQSDTQLIGLGIQFPFEMKTMPNVEVSNCHASLMVLNVTMVQPALVGHGSHMQRGQQATLRERVVTDWFGRMQRERRHSTTITVTNKQRIPHPCQLYRTPFRVQASPMLDRQFDEDIDTTIQDCPDSSEMGTNHSSEMGTNHSSEMGTNHSSEMGTNHSSEMGTNHSSEMGTNHSSEMGTNHSSEMGTNHSSEMGTNHSSEMGTNHSSEMGTNHSSEMGTNHSSEMGTNHSSEMGTNHSSEMGTNHSSEMGTNHSSEMGTNHSSEMGTNHSSEMGHPDTSNMSIPDSFDYPPDFFTFYGDGSSLRSTNHTLFSLELSGGTVDSEEIVDLTPLNAERATKAVPGWELSPMNSQAERIADLVDRWVEGMWIELPKGWRRSRGPGSTHSPFTALEFEERTLAVAAWLGCVFGGDEMMLALEHVGELRERIGRVLPTLHPSLVAESGIGRWCGESAIWECLLGVWRELELLWQVTSLSNVSDEDFWSCFGLTFETSERIVGAMTKLVEHCGTAMPRYRNLCLFLLAKAEFVMERMKRCREAEATSFGSLSKTTAHINDLDEILVDDYMKDWKNALPPIADIADDVIVARQRELRDLDEEVWELEHECRQALEDEPDQETMRLMKPPAELVLHRWRIVRDQLRILPQAWALFDFFGSLTMTLSPRHHFRPTIQSVYQPRLRVRGSAAREDDILLAMQHVCSIICYVNFNTFQVYVHSGRSVEDKLKKGKECKQLMVALWEFLPEHFPHMHQHVKETLEQLEHEKKYPSART